VIGLQNSRQERFSVEAVEKPLFERNVGKEMARIDRAIFVFGFPI
jgi:hypothetical protein